MYEAPDADGGVTLACSGCGETLRVPPPLVLLADPVDPTEAVQPAPGPGVPSLPAVRRPAALRQGVAATVPPPAVRRTQRRGWPVWAQLIVLGVMLASGALAAGGCAAVGAALYEGYQCYTSEEQPEQVRLGDFLARWPQGNHHVILTHFVCGTPFYIGGDANGSGLWIPIHPVEDVGRDGRPVPAQVKILVFCNNAAREDAVLQQCRQGHVQGLVIRGVNFGGGTGHFLLKESPKTILATCLTLEVGRKPWSHTSLYALGITGAAAILVGGILAVVCLGVLAPDLVRGVVAVLLFPFQRRVWTPASSA
jgi:hypothetical protein